MADEEEAELTPEQLIRALHRQDAKVQLRRDRRARELLTQERVNIVVSVMTSGGTFAQAAEAAGYKDASSAHKAWKAYLERQPQPNKQQWRTLFLRRLENQLVSLGNARAKLEEKIESGEADFLRLDYQRNLALNTREIVRILDKEALLVGAYQPVQAQLKIEDGGKPVRTIERVVFLREVSGPNGGQPGRDVLAEQETVDHPRLAQENQSDGGSDRNR